MYLDHIMFDGVFNFTDKQDNLLDDTTQFNYYNTYLTITAEGDPDAEQFNVIPFIRHFMGNKQKLNTFLNHKNEIIFNHNKLVKKARKALQETIDNSILTAQGLNGILTVVDQHFFTPLHRMGAENSYLIQDGVKVISFPETVDFIKNIISQQYPNFLIAYKKEFEQENKNDYQ